MGIKLRKYDLPMLGSNYERSYWLKLGFIFDAHIGCEKNMFTSDNGWGGVLIAFRNTFKSCLVKLLLIMLNNFLWRLYGLIFFKNDVDAYILLTMP